MGLSEFTIRDCVQPRTIDAILDSLGLRSIDILKIDVEGGELAAIQRPRRPSGIHQV